MRGLNKTSTVGLQRRRADGWKIKDTKKEKKKGKRKKNAKEKGSRKKRERKIKDYKTLTNLCKIIKHGKK